MVTCNICGKEFKNSQGLRGHNHFVHSDTGNTARQPVAQLTQQHLSSCLGPRLTTEQRVSELEHKLARLESITGVIEPDELDKLLGTTDKPLTEQMSELAELVGQLTDQLNGLAEQVELGRVVKATADGHETEHKRELEQLRNEWENAYNRLVGIINRNSELVRKSFSIAEDEAKATNGQVNDLKNVVGQLEKRVASEVALENQLHGKLDEMERKLSRFESKLGMMRNLMHRQPTGRLVSVALNDGRGHQFKEYGSPEGLTRPQRHHFDLLLGHRWIDLAEPED